MMMDEDQYNERYCRDCTYVQGNSVPVEPDCDHDYRTDIPVHKKSGIRIWGRVKSDDYEPVEGALVQLLRLEYAEHSCRLVSVAHTVSDCKGFYQFEIPEKAAHCEYRVLAGKAATGRERVIASSGCCYYGRK